jgi:hypothetical protein
MEPRRLVFFASLDPEKSPGPAWSAYHFALVAHRAGLPAEVRLAGDAVKILQEGVVPENEGNKTLFAYMSEAVESGLFVSG